MKKLLLKVVQKALETSTLGNFYKFFNKKYRTTNKPSFAINPFQDNVPFPYPLKTSENQRFFDVLRGYRKAILA